ncbi:flavodoxin domain-containing protein [Crystallibacter degradans]|uniref:flavodoxin domain-containing protein n=1 Tax=Crystallibacter degradans TaxID=2726743 RepID=UPI001474E4C7|nr:flavodoxin domain-containing protein [Arthrobacter sp. SF27]NMR30621.1 flavodoxin [Arthrobacter sp. SF27]
MRILIGYASQSGSTAEIAEWMAAVLQQDHNVDVLEIGQIGSLDNYEAVVLGSAIHSQSWLPAAAEFVHGHAGALRTKPIWLFSVGMSDGLPRPLRKLAKTAQDKRIALAFRDKIQPRSHRVFSGVCRAEQLPRPGRMLFVAGGGHFGDYRDRAEIEAWAREISRALIAGAYPAGPATG